ncbi:LANO_0A05886g1_1 [Lachancea nothofagi CBS 11611]|uniref:LANO_0A05886g1_1 n=1 Tax=Lachancea nothofagi CBS 11611 TaxID=1266666 RepID=A0A1G4IRQ8_9SACH|nr:LANO_0A05886g1_1 [Lachancea nothofagi CBS 11611]
MTGLGPSMQLINEEKEFNSDVLDFFNKHTNSRDVGMDYHVISVFGSQSSGKSTLLNAVFGTKFDTMNAKEKRQQTTKGIWLGHTKEVAVTSNKKEPIKDLFVLDVEGSDGAERGEDQDFERKAALFAIAVSEILIVNMWEQQVGLYQGNNMALLKTVFEVNLSLFGHRSDHKVLLLFVIRDHVGVTPLTSLQETLEAELQEIWAGLTKPEGCEDKTLADFFDLKFTALAHKVLQPDAFMENVGTLGSRFANESDPHVSYFKPAYHHNLPIDGWTMYANNCWNQIETNKDLDLPTQQILVAKFKTEEIAQQSFGAFLENYPNEAFSSDQKQELVDTLQELKSECLREYDTYASRYAKPVYIETKKGLASNIEAKCKETISKFFAGTIEALVAAFERDLLERTKPTSFVTKLETARCDAIEKFQSFVSDFLRLELVSSLKDEEETFLAVLDQACTVQSQKQLKTIITRSGKEISNGIKEDIIVLLTHPDKNLWDHVMDSFNTIISRTTQRFGLEDNIFDFQVGLSQAENEKVYKQIRSGAWASLHEIVNDCLTEDNVVSILRERFENKFRFDENDSPRLWKNEEEIDTAYRVAKEHALEVIGVLSLASTANHTEIIPDVPVKVPHGLDDEVDLQGEFEDEEGVYHQKSFAHILTASQREKILRNFKRQSNTTVIEAKRSIIRTTSHIPVYVYALIAVLGWNEFLMVIRNPLFVTLLLIFGVAFYFVHKLNLWNPILALANSAINETKSLAKDKLKGLLDDNPSKAPTKAVPSYNEQKSKSSMEEFEMQDFPNGSSSNNGDSE